MNEPWRCVLRMPLDEVIRNVFEGQQIEEDDGGGAQIRLLHELMAKLI